MPSFGTTHAERGGSLREPYRQGHGGGRCSAVAVAWFVVAVEACVSEN